MSTARSCATAGRRSPTRSPSSTTPSRPCWWTCPAVRCARRWSPPRCRAGSPTSRARSRSCSAPRATPHTDAWARVTVTDAHRPEDLYRRVKQRFPHALVVHHRAGGARRSRPRTTVVTAAHDPLDVDRRLPRARHRARPDARRGRRAAARVRGRRRDGAERLMHLRTLTLQAIGPFAGRHTVDFDALGQAGLFLLEGPTGLRQVDAHRRDRVRAVREGRVRRGVGGPAALGVRGRRRRERGRPGLRGARRASTACDAPPRTSGPSGGAAAPPRRTRR